MPQHEYIPTGNLSILNKSLSAYNGEEVRFSPNKCVFLRPLTTIDIADLVLGIGTAIPCGLIINELVSNALKYAFPKDNKGEIKIAFHSFNENEVELIVSDNGVGLPKDFDLTNPESMGLRLVRIMTEQIEGKLELDRNDGTKFQIRFKKMVG